MVSILPRQKTYLSEKMINTLPQSLIESAKKVLVESTSPRLHHIADVKINFPDADYYVIRKGTPDTVGKITKEFSPEHIGVKINRTDVMDPRYHQYAMQYAHMNGYWKPKAKGALRLQHISVDDVKNMPALYRGLNESAEHPMIDVDGEMKHRHNSNGVPIHHSDEGIRNFHRWFDGSHAVDEHGRPLVVYHGSDNDFDKFSIDKIGSKNDSGFLGRGFYFSTSKNTAKSYQSDLSKEPKPFYLKLKAPQKGSWYSGEGYMNATKFSGDQDGAMWDHEDYDNPGTTGSIEFVVKHPHQIKSAIGNNGDFHPDKPQINESTEEPQIHTNNSLGMPIHRTVEGIHNFNKWFDGSQVKDEHGRPLVVYHGTNAHAYSPDEEIKNFHTNPESGRGAAFFTSNKSLAHEYGEKVYHTYLKLKNPLVIDAQGKHWSSISHNSPIKGEATEQLNSARKQKHDEMESIAKDMQELFDDTYSPREFNPIKGSLEGHQLKHIPGLEHDDLETDQVVNVAKKHGFDGVVFKNVKDSPTNDHGYRHDTADVYAVFHPQHIKSTDNNGQFGTEWHHGIKE